MKTIEVEAPDGGWGVLVCIGMALPFISGLAALPSFGLLFNDFLKSVGAETSETAFITSAFFCAFSFAGLSSGLLTKYCTLRMIGIFGAVFYFIGSIAQIFVSSVFHLIISFSIIQGAGFGLIVPISYATFNNYFVKKRVMWMSFAQSLIGLGSMLYPIVINLLLQNYGFRGCLIILAAINSHGILGMILMQPVEWHMKEIKKNNNELLIRKHSSLSLENTKDSQNDNSTTVADKKVHKINTSQSSSIANLGNWTGSILISDAASHAVKSARSSFQSRTTNLNNKINCSFSSIIQFLDLNLLKKPVYINIVLGISFALYSDIAFFTLQPLYLFELGYNKLDISNIIAIGAAADLISRIALALLAKFFKIPSRYIYLAGAVFTILSRIAFLQLSEYKSMAYATALMGFLRTWLHVPLPLVFAEYLPKERFSSGYGLFMFLQGNIMFAVGPFVGYLRDRTNYIITFHCLNVFMALCAVPWIIELVYSRISKYIRN